MKENFPSRDKDSKNYVKYIKDNYQVISIKVALFLAAEALQLTKLLRAVKNMCR